MEKLTTDMNFLSELFLVTSLITSVRQSAMQSSCGSLSFVESKFASFKSLFLHSTNSRYSNSPRWIKHVELVQPLRICPVAISSCLHGSMAELGVVTCGYVEVTLDLARASNDGSDIEPCVLRFLLWFKSVLLLNVVKSTISFSSFQRLMGSVGYPLVGQAGNEKGTSSLK